MAKPKVNKKIQAKVELGNNLNNMFVFGYIAGKGYDLDKLESYRVEEIDALEKEAMTKLYKHQKERG